MARVIFSINLRNDAWNWVRIAKAKRLPYGRTVGMFDGDFPPAILRGIRRRSITAARKYVYVYLKSRQNNFRVDFLAMKTLLDEYFTRHGLALLREVARLTGCPMYRQTFHADFTLMSSCPYNYPKAWFMVSAKRNMPTQIKIVCHEILHLQFIHFYYHYCRDHGLTEKQFQDIKEAMTVLLNEPQFRKFHLALDVGYTDHVRLRKFITRQWRKRQPYRQFLDACIAETKRTLPPK